MDSTQTTASRREKKGIAKLWAKLWAKFKASLGFKSQRTPPLSSLAVADNATSNASTNRPVTHPTAHSTTRSSSTGTTQVDVAWTTGTSDPLKELKSTFGDLEAEKSNHPVDVCLTADVIEAEEDDRGTARVFFAIPEASRQLTGPRVQHRVVTLTDPTNRNYLKAQAIFEKYNLHLDPKDWQTTTSTQLDRERIEKKARIRIRYSCHKCREAFGRDRWCLRCHHKRCAKCVRYPTQKLTNATGVAIETHI